jgi:hypothetical protein
MTDQQPQKDWEKFVELVMNFVDSVTEEISDIKYRLDKLEEHPDATFFDDLHERMNDQEFRLDQLCIQRAKGKREASHA